MAAPVKPGYTTTEFWVTLLTVVASVVGVYDPTLHLSGYVQTAAVVAAGVSTIVYTFLRSGLKAAASKAAQDVEDIATHASAS